MNELLKTLELGSYNVAPSQLTQGASLSMEQLSQVMQNVCWGENMIKLQKVLPVEKQKSQLAQFNRQLSYGDFHGLAALEGALGNTSVGQYQRVVFPMAYYNTVGQVTVPAAVAEAFDGVGAEEREAINAAKRLALAIEFDSFRGKADFSNGGVFDGNPLAIPDTLPNMSGIDLQIRQADSLISTADQMMFSYSGNQSIVLSKNGSLDQAIIEKAANRVQMNYGTPDVLYVDPIVLSGYNTTVALGVGTNSIQRIVLGQQPQASGVDLRRQITTGGASVALEGHRVLSGKTAPLPPNQYSPNPPTINTITATGSNGAIPPGQYRYLVTAMNHKGESNGTFSAAITVGANQRVEIDIAPNANTEFFAVYRAIGAASTQKDAKFIGFVKASSPSTLFIDLGNKQPGFVTGYMLQHDTWSYFELAPFTRVKLGVLIDLTYRSVFYRFLTIGGLQPRKNAIIDNLF